MDYLFIIYGLPIIALLITLCAQCFISSSYKKYSKIRNKIGLTGAEVARKILDKNGLTNINIEETNGYLTDHYDPGKKVIRLSKSIYNEISIASLAVASHECGHAIQDKEDYRFYKIRRTLVPITNFSSYAGYFAIAFGIVFGMLNLIWVGIIFEMVILLFELVTLPVELDASKRALKELEKGNILNAEELTGGKKVLTAAALTYVASIATTLLQILRLIVMFGRNRD